MVKSNSTERSYQGKLRISASLIASPWLDLKHTIKDLEDNGVEMLHFDIEDRHFTPYLSFGTKLICELRPFTDLLFDIHLMVDNPELYIDDLVKIGVDRIAFHWESTQYPLRILDKIKINDIKAGLAFNPGTQIPDLTDLLSSLDFVNLLSTKPSGSNNKFISSTLNKLSCGFNKYSPKKLEWVVDGGVTDENILSIMSCHADAVVIGRYLFEDCISEKINQINRLVNCKSPEQ
jgi:ribulose-phosphate 3-epimerase